MYNILNHQRNADGHYYAHSGNKLIGPVVGAHEQRSAHTLLVGEEVASAALNNCYAVCNEAESKQTLRPSVPLVGMFPQECLHAFA